ncbi:hypothetical protein BD311DRAFT_865287 [Dichomitus squalens]|uniref:C2H2-type domain-containing protein n=1 Tax=Dichomitus squalens TaxID=114155 RepID=A0A4Q9MMQ6_9APHY|nr:hypothetical protein BD311DRAFT_865287 [Dichomitus squalens]
MNNGGDGQIPRQYSLNELVLSAANGAMSPEDEFAKRRQRIEAIKERLRSAEEQVEIEYMQYLEKKEKLQAEVLRGQLAAQRLQELEGTVPVQTNTILPVAGPSTAWQSLPTYQVAPQSVQQYTELPSTARIVEVPSPQISPQVHPHAPVASSSRSDTIPAQTYSQTHKPSLHLPPPSFAASSQPAPVSQPVTDWTAYGADPKVMNQQPLGPHLQRSSYRPVQWPASNASYYQSQTYNYASQRPSSAPLVPPVPHSSQYKVTQSSSSVPQAGHVAPSGMHSVGSSATPAARTSTQAIVDGASHARQAHNSDVSHTDQTSPSESAQHYPTLPSSIPPHHQRMLFEYLERLDDPIKRAIMVLVLMMAERREKGRQKTAEERVLEARVGPAIIRSAQTIADAWKMHDASQIQRLFSDYIQWLNSRRQARKAAAGEAANVEQSQPSQFVQLDPAMSASSRAGVPPAPSTGARAQQASVPLPAVAEPSPFISSSTHTNATPASTSTLRPTSEPSMATTSRIVPADRLRPFPWYRSRDPNAPVPFSDDNGQVYWLPPHAVPQSKPPVPGPSTLPIPKILPRTTAFPQRRPASEARQSALWTPEKADKSRLAQDIMRSLGRPKGAFGAPLVDSHSSFIPWFEVVDSSSETPSTTSTGKRRASLTPSASPTTIAKRPRLESEVETRLPIVPASDVQPDATIEVVAPASEQGAESPVAVAVVEPIPPDPAPPQADEPMERDVEAAEKAVSDIPEAGRAQSIPSSDGALDLVQDMLVAPPDTDPAAPPSSDPYRGLPYSPDEVVGPVEPLGGLGAQELHNLPSTAAPSAAPSSSHPSSSHPSSVDGSRATPPPRSSSPSQREKTKEKIPLFLPSPSPTSAVDEHNRPDGSPTVDDVDMRSDASEPPRLPRHLKGKGRAVEDDDVTSETSSVMPGATSRVRRRVNRAYVLVPPLPQYARRKTALVSRSGSVASGSQNASASARSARSTQSASRSRGATASVHEGEGSIDELAAWHGGSLCMDESDCGKSVDQIYDMLVDEGMVAAEPQRDKEEVEAEAEAEQLSFTRLRQTPCSWSECGVILNSATTLQKHVALHADENEEWGTFTCRWNNCFSTHFVDKQSLVKHVQKHTKSPLWCAYEGCDTSYASPSELCRHQQSSKHQDGQLRRSCLPAPPPERMDPLPPLPDHVPAYMSVERRVGRHPTSRERHQWLGPKVLENITSFKYTGRRSNAALPLRGSRRLAEKVAAAELAAVPPESAIDQIKRWIDDEYLDFADGYDASRRYRVWCADIPSGEITRMVDDGLVLWADGREDSDQRDQHAEADGPGVDGGGQEPAGEGDEDAEGEDDAEFEQEHEHEREPEEPPPPRVAGSSDEGAGLEGSPVRTEVSGGADGGGRPTPKPKLPLPRRSQVRLFSARPNRTDDSHDVEGVAGNTETDAEGRGERPSTPAPVPNSVPAAPSPNAPSSPPPISMPEPKPEEPVGSVWTAWPPAKEGSVGLR